MNSFLIKTELMPIELNLSAAIPQFMMTDEQFYTFCQTNRDLRIEKAADGNVVIMPPVFSDTGNRNFRIAQQVGNWADQDNTGEVFDSSAGFTLPNGAIRSPDVAWIKHERWD
ncbi:MAG: Uma2 family endonuclease, partial [Cyanobacteria bacterium P01_F01_bin.42]